MGATMVTNGDIRDALYAYTLAHTGVGFVHQHVVDAMAAQDADDATTPRQLIFALVGLYLHVERHESGRYVQRVHAALAQQRVSLPAIALPVDRGAITAADVLATAAGPERDAMISTWCASVWSAYASARLQIVGLVERAQQ